jgi:CubicO group peptidase (beta-lactamase class C family)
MASPNSLMHRRFAVWIDDSIARGRLPTAEVIVRHKGREIAHYRNPGLAKTPVPGEASAIYRLYSMTKPVVSLAVMLLFEEGKFQLSEPVWKFLGPKWKKQNMKVLDLAAADTGKPEATVPCKKSITIFHLLTHTSGLSHGLSPPELNQPLDNYYASVGLGSGSTLLPTEKKVPGGPVTLQELCDRLAECPLLFQPGEHWQYSYGVDLLGRIVEVVSGQGLEEFVQERIFRPLGMIDTTFFLPKEKAGRLSDVWLPPMGKNRKLKSFGASLAPLPFASGSGGLYGTASDYMLFAEMLRQGGVGINNVRIASRKTIQFMTINHLRSTNKDRQPRTISQMSLRNFAAEHPPGLGFGLGFGVWTNPTDAVMEFDGSFFWAGAASTHFFVNRQEELTVVFCTQILLADPIQYPIMQALRSLAYGALEDNDAPDGDVQKSKL